MEKSRARHLVQSITRQITIGSTIDIRKLSKKAWQRLKLPLLGNERDILAVFEVHENENDYWIALTNWRRNNPANYYLVTYGRDGLIKILGELHESDGLELQWQYRPSLKDNRNEERVRRFVQMYGSIGVNISLPATTISADEFLTDVLRVAEIRKTAQDLSTIIRLDEDGAFPEGRRIEWLHKRRERSSRVVREAKERHARANNGNLPCEACGFDFQELYGDRGRHFIEAHHKVPLSELKEDQIAETFVDDLALVCANCHRMLHKKPYSTVEDLRAKL